MAHAVHAATSPAAARMVVADYWRLSHLQRLCIDCATVARHTWTQGDPIVMDAPRRRAPGFVDLVLLRGKRSENACTAVGIDQRTVEPATRALVRVPNGDVGAVASSWRFTVC